MDKKIILKEIEVLIRSIKVHYDNIENEYRIPTIELELITSKIRKLHEKSIIYNHLHYMEEELSQQSKKVRFDLDTNEPPAFKPAEISSDFVVKKSSILNQDTIVVEEKKIEPPAIIEVPKEEEKVIAIVNEPIVEIKPLVATAPKNIASKIGINDRFRFIKDLFNGNGLLLEESIQSLNTCTSQQEVEMALKNLLQKFNWNKEDESVIDFNILVLSQFK